MLKLELSGNIFNEIFILKEKYSYFLLDEFHIGWIEKFVDRFFPEEREHKKL